MIYRIRMIFVAALAAILCGCTQNDGRIGPLFGSWLLEEITDADDEVVPQPEDQNLVWQFQNDVVCMKELLLFHERVDYWGRWQQTGSVLELNYDNHDDDEEADWLYRLPKGYGFPPAPAILRFEVAELTGSRLTVSYITEEGITLRYRFKKTL